MFFFTLPGFLSLLLSVSLGFAARWDRAAAQAALTEARQMREELAKAKAPSKEKYLAVVRTYKEVSARDPHYSGSDDAVYEAGEVYQEMGEKFGSLLYYQDAAKMYQFLLKDYGSSPRCPDALLRIGDLYSGPLENEAAAQQAYQRLRKEFRKSKAAAELNHKDAATQAAAKHMAAKETAAREAKEAAREPAVINPPAAAPGGENGTCQNAIVQNIRHWTTSDYTRVIIDLDAQTSYSKTRLSNPDRIFFDISNAKLGKELSNRTFVVSDEFLKQVRVGQNRSDVVRVVLDFAAISDYSVFELHDPFRIVVDIHGMRNEKVRAEKPAPMGRQREEPREEPIPLPPPPAESKRVQAQEEPASKAAATPTTETAQPAPGKPADEKTSLKIEELPVPAPVDTNIKASQPAAGAEATKTAKAKTSPAAHPAAPAAAMPLPKTADPTSMGNRTMTRVLGLKIGRIVIDPGHGGHDIGTIGRGGMMEKELVLNVAHDLKKLLENKIGAEVVLTRNDDTFISLEERTAIANQARADLFISIHANSSSSRVTSGVETYYLDFARNEAEREVAARENASTVQNVRDLQNLVRKIAQADKSAESRELAAILQKKLYGGARQLFPMAKNRGVRSAPFVVLIGANMPSVLAEVAFISNPRDEKVLKQESNRTQLARALFAGIEGYMKTLGSEMARNRPGDE